MINFPKNKFIFTLLAFSIFHNAQAGVSIFKDPVFEVDVHIEELGIKNSESVLLVHGLGDNAARDWVNIAPILAKKFHVIMLDLPGFGKTGHAKKTFYTPKNYSQLLSVVAKKYSKSEKIILIGHSLGGAISLSFTHNNPEQIKKLVLIDAAGILHRSVYVKHLAMFKPNGISGIPFSGLLNKAVKSINNFTGGMIEFTDNFTSVQDMLMRDPNLRAKLAKDNLTVRAAANLIATDFGEALDSIKIPTLILWGDQDKIAPLRTGKLLNHHLENSALKIFKGIGHVPMAEIAQKVNSTILGWLETPYTDIPLKPEITETNYECKSKMFDKPRIITGGHNVVKISSCENLLLKDLTAKRIEVTSSRVEMENVVIESATVGLIANKSEIKATNLSINAKEDAIQISGSKMDIVGAKINAGKKIVAPKQKSLIYWSLGTLTSPGLGTIKIHKRLTYKAD